MRILLLIVQLLRDPGGVNVARARTPTMFVELQNGYATFGAMKQCCITLRRSDVRRSACR